LSDTVGIAAPWITYAEEVNALFDKDPEVLVQYDNDNTELKLYVDNAAKADALSRLLPTEKSFGNVTLNISVIPANDNPSKISLFRNAFAGNPIFDSIETVPFAQNAPIEYIIFAREVVSFFNDDMGDFYGAKSTLYEDIARDVFDTTEDGIFFCTKIETSDKEDELLSLG
jgi:hypothetical protein